MRILVFGGSGTVGINVLNYLSKNNFKEVFFTYHENKVDSFFFQSYCTKNKNYKEIIKDVNPSLVINCVSGLSGVDISLYSVQEKIDIFVANKETFCILGNYILDLAKQNNIKIIPLDSEHISTLDLIKDKKKIKKIYLMSSGGSFYKKTKKYIDNLDNENFYRHPNWNMGKKITFNSNIMINKLLEVIEAYWLFSTRNIEIVIEQSSHIHSIVQFSDNTFRISYYKPNMFYAVSLAFSIYNNVSNEIYEDNEEINLVSKLSFIKPPSNKFVSLSISQGFLADPSLSKSILICTVNDILTDWFIENKINLKEFNFYFKKIYNLYKKNQVSGITSIYEFINIIKRRLELWVQRDY